MQTIIDARTLGLSPKAVLAFIYPALVTASGVIASWIVSGVLDAGELRGAAAGLLLSAVSALGAAIGSTGILRTGKRTAAPVVPSDVLVAAAGGLQPTDAPVIQRRRRTDG